MIDSKIKGADLVGRKCRPVHSIRNGGGHGITRTTICTIKAVVRGHGFTVETEPCPHCGQYTRISRIARADLELIEEE